MASNLVTVEEAAFTLGFSVQHTRLLIRQGKLRANKLGRDWVITREALADYIVKYPKNQPKNTAQRQRRETPIKTHRGEHVERSQ